MLTVDHADLSQSTRASGDWDSGARKASCPDGQRLIGLSHTGFRGLCTDAGGALGAGTAEVVWDERHVTADWARGYTKFECPRGAALIGYSVRGPNLSSALCGRGSGAGTGGRTLWFDRGDNRPRSQRWRVRPGPLQGPVRGRRVRGRHRLDEPVRPPVQAARRPALPRELAR